MQIVSGAAGELPEGIPLRLARYRYRVFVEKLGWALSTANEMEKDQFDRPDTVYVVGQMEKRVIGCARLLPTTKPYLLSELFSELLNGLNPPCSSEVWELSRFAAVDFDDKRTSALGQFSSPVAVQLLRESILCAKAHGAKEIITVSPIGVERLLRYAGFTCHRAGPPRIIHGYPLFACWIDVKSNS